MEEEEEEMGGSSFFLFVVVIARKEGVKWLFCYLIVNWEISVSTSNLSTLGQKNHQIWLPSDMVFTLTNLANR